MKTELGTEQVVCGYCRTSALFMFETGFSNLKKVKFWKILKKVAIVPCVYFLIAQKVCGTVSVTIPEVKPRKGIFIAKCLTSPSYIKFMVMPV